MNTTPVDPKKIAQVTLEAEGDAPPDPDRTQRLERELTELRETLAEKTAECDSALARNDAEAVKARMMRPFADKTFAFVCWYCVITAGLIILDGWVTNEIDIPDSVLTIIAGSTAVSALGLVSIVVSGLFRSK